MKQFLFSVLLPAVSFIPPSEKTFAQSLAGYKTGYVITADGRRKDGFIKENFKSKASITFQSTEGRKTFYTGDNIKEVGVEGTVYISYLSDFFKVVKNGTKMSLYQKASDASGNVIYNGSQAVGINPGTEGSVNDHFIKIPGSDKMILITKKNFEQVVLTNCTDCPALLESVKTNKVNYEEIGKVVQLYNECK